MACINFLPALLLHDVAAGAGAQDALGIQRLVVHRNDENEQLRRQGLNVLDQFQPVLVRQGNVSQHQVRLAGHQTCSSA